MSTAVGEFHTNFKYTEHSHCLRLSVGLNKMKIGRSLERTKIKLLISPWTLIFHSNETAPAAFVQTKGLRG